MRQDPEQPADRASNPLQPVTLTGKPFRRIVQEGEDGALPAPGEPAKVRLVDPEYRRTQMRKRRELAQILWGDTETDDWLPHGAGPPVPQPATAPAPAPQDTVQRRRFLRRACSFPGLLRVMVPEISFQPRLFVVRLVDVCPKGCRLETRQLTHALANMIGEQPRQARIEAIVPGREKLILQGQIAWARCPVEGLAHMGISFEREIENLEQLFFAENPEDSTATPFTLASPALDAFPSVVREMAIDFAGSAPGAESVLVRHRLKTRRVPVRDGRFAVEMPLTPGRSNVFSFVAENGAARSVPTPVCVLQQQEDHGRLQMGTGELVQALEVDEAGGRLTLRLAGPPRRFFQALKSIEHALQHAEHVELGLELTGDVAKARRLFETLEKDL
ncbi:MAG: hypothetical protein KF858_08050 [Candidatus Sumerlaeia bacterium]|nr:hypothetical protein [Candidatus Sumerlaeia bacterium]